MTHHLNHTRTAAVAADTYWLPIDANTPRNVKCLAIARESSGVAQQVEIPTHNTWWTHWHPLPRFRPDTWEPNVADQKQHSNYFVSQKQPDLINKSDPVNKVVWAEFDPEDDNK